MRLCVALLLLAFAGCEDRDLCAESPLCDGTVSVNCEPACQVGPCSNSPQQQACGADTTCNIEPGTPSSPRFFRSRALCILNETDRCDPASAPPPTCDAERRVTGCSAYKRQIRVACSQAGMFFDDAACCSGRTDAGTPDAGPLDAGTDGGR